MFKKAKIFKNGQSQAVRLPHEYRFQDKEVYIKREGNLIMLIPIDNPWQNFKQSLSCFSPDFMNTRKQPQQKRESLFS